MEYDRDGNLLMCRGCEFARGPECSACWPYLIIVDHIDNDSAHPNCPLRDEEHGNDGSEG